MSPTLTTFLFEVANFLVLAAVMGWLFFKPVRQALRDYRAKFEADNALAEKKLAQAEELQAEMKSAKSTLQLEVNQIRQRAIEESRRTADKLIVDARATIDREFEISQRQAMQLSETQRDKLACASATVAAELVGRLLNEFKAVDLQTALIESACEQIATLPRAGIEPVTVESAQPLTELELSKLNEALSAAGAVKLLTASKIVEELGSGIRVLSANGLVDASVSGLTLFARQALVRELGQCKQQRHVLQDTKDE